MTLLQDTLILKIQKTSVVFNSLPNLFFTLNFSNVKGSLKLFSKIPFDKNDKSFELER
jgi:hypothetical protein